MDKENTIENLIYLFSKLPGLGPRSARRIVIHLLEDKKHRMTLLSNALSLAATNVEECKICFNIDTNNPCSICSSEVRDFSTIAIVENIADLWALERSNSFKGLFHVLGANLNAQNGKKPEDLRLNHLATRIQNSSVKELIIATNATLDGQTTAFYITEMFKDFDIKITRLASGIPIGGELDYLDEGTLTAALNLRRPF
jgi:recombination protein RecR